MAKKKKPSRYRRRRNQGDDAPSPARARAGRVTEAATEFAYTVGAGFAGYAAARGAGRLVHQFAGRRYPKLARHASVLGSVIGATGVYLGSRYWDKVADYHDAVAVGAGVAVAQGIVQAYLPQWAWVVSDLPDPARMAMQRAPGAQALPAPGVEIDRLLAAGELEEVPVGSPTPSMEEAVGDLGDLGMFEN